MLTLISAGRATAQTEVKRTHLVELTGMLSKQAAEGLLRYDDYGRMVVSSVRGRLLVLATDAELALMNERGWQPEVLMTDTSQVRLFKRGIYGPTLELPAGYHTYEEIRALVDSLAAAHPKLISRFPIGWTTQEKREIFAVKISNDVGVAANKPVIMFDGCHHADEIMGAEIVTAIMRMLIEGYGVDPQITSWVDAYEFYLVPVVSVDGYHVVTHNVDPRWRKNTRDTNENGVLYEYPEGVDVNRNYDFNWARGGTSDSSSVRYRGEYPFSEAENRAMRSLVERIRPTLSISYHSQGEVIYYPWVWGTRHAPDDELLTQIARGLAGSIPTMEGDTTYVAEYGAGMVGQSYPWLYGRYGDFDFIVETGKGAHIFPPEEVGGIVANNLNGARYLMSRGEGPGFCVKVTDAESGDPLSAEVWLPAIETEDVDRRRTRAETGGYWRLLRPGKYAVHVTADGYDPALLEVEVPNAGWNCLTVRLRPETGDQ